MCKSLGSSANGKASAALTPFPRGAAGGPPVRAPRAGGARGDRAHGRPRLGRRGAVYAPSPSQRNRSDSLPKPFELPEVRAVVRATRLSCQNARKAQKFTPVRGSSGESRLIVPVTSKPRSNDKHLPRDRRERRRA